MLKYIFITGGVVSGLGKGITAASLGRLLINRGFRVTVQKLDPYINIDPSLMSPLEHGEVFVTADGAECDVDVGHYERFLGSNFTRDNNVTSGRIYNAVITREREGAYNGKTIQVIPHITDEIKKTMRSVAKQNEDIVIVEIGGTVGDMEQMAFIEAIRQFRKELGANNSVSVHVTLVPYLHCSGEIKTKPTQNSVRDLSQMGVFPDFVICRTNADVKLDTATREKIAMFCSLDGSNYVIHNSDCATIYQVPIMFREQGLDKLVMEKLGLEPRADTFGEWESMANEIAELEKNKTLTVAIAGKYADMPDAYLSITEAIKHAGLKCKKGINIKFADCNKIDLSEVDGVVIRESGESTRGILKQAGTVYLDIEQVQGRRPEFTSRPFAPNPLFVEFIEKIVKEKQ